MSSGLYLIDAFGQIFRSYFAFAGKPLVNADGKNVNAFFGFFKSLFVLLRERRPTHLAVVYDSRTPTFRHEIYPAYKAHRDAAPEDLIDQLPEIEELLRVLGVPILQKDGFEADDLMATMGQYCRERDLPCWIVSGDKDMLQMVGGSLKVLKTDQRGQYVEMDEDRVLADKGVNARQIIDYLALLGDTSDNVPGVAGVGEKTAQKLLAEFGDLDSLYASLDRVSSESQRKKLSEGRESAYLSRRLVTLRTDVPLDLPADDPLEALTLRFKDAQAAAALFLKQSAKGLAADVLAFAAGNTPAAGAKPNGSTDALGTASAGPNESGGAKETALSAAAEKGTYEIVLSESDLDRWISLCAEAGVFAVDLETDSLDTFAARIAGISLSYGAGKGAYIPLIAPDADCLEATLVLSRLKPLLESPASRIIGQNFKFDWKVLIRHGIRVPRIYFDTLTAAWLLDANAGIYNLEALALSYLGYEGVSYDSIVPKGKDFTAVPLATAGHYSAEDADLTFRLYKVFSPLLEKQGLSDLLFDLEMPLALILARMENEGISLRAQELAEYSQELDLRIQEVQKEIWTLCGREFNLGSPKQLQEVLYTERQLTPPPRARIKTGFSTDSDILDELSAQDPVPAKILRYRALTKLKSTYVDTLPLQINPVTGRIHTQFLQSGTASGRLASKDPNLQNIPIREEEGRRIRRAFVPRDGWSFVSADYSQIELVVLAHLSQDPNLVRAFQDGRDIHRWTASLMFGVFEELVNNDMRRAAKTINFGIMYGMSAFRLANELKISRKEADQFMGAYYREFAGVMAYFQTVIRDAEQKGHVTTMLGHKRAIPNILGRNRVEKQAAERVAMNSPIQGSAADIVKMAMIKVDARLVREGLSARLILQVHDELLVECPDDEVEAVKILLREEMESAVSLTVPLRIGLEAGKNWGEFH